MGPSVDYSTEGLPFRLDQISGSRPVWNMHSRRDHVPLTPLTLEFLRRQVTQRRVNPLPVVDIVEEPTQLPPSVREVLVLREIDLLLLDRSHQPLGISILFR